MTETKTRTDLTIEAALLDADLFVKYGSVERAFELLNGTIERQPRSIPLREKMREIAITYTRPLEAARQCLALASLYITREEFDTAYDRLQEAKTLDPRISIAPGLEAIRRAKHPEFAARQTSAAPQNLPAFDRNAVLAGNLSYIGLFDAIQAIENSRLSGMLTLKNSLRTASILFNEGRIVDAECEGSTGTQAFRLVVEISEGVFDFTRSEKEFPVVIQSTSNTNLLLDTLSSMDEENR